MQDAAANWGRNQGNRFVFSIFPAPSPGTGPVDLFGTEFGCRLLHSRGRGAEMPVSHNDTEVGNVSLGHGSP